MNCTCNQKPTFPAHVRASVNGFERIISFQPGYVCERPRGSSGSHGIHGMEMIWLLKGPKGAIQFLVYTGWLPNWEPHHEPTPCHPLPADVGYHSTVPLHEGQKLMADECPWLGGPCYYDGSSLHAQRVFKILVNDGEEAVWSELEDVYRDRFSEE